MLAFRNIFIFLIILPYILAKLRFVQIWFRHGERLPTHYLHFPGENPENKDYLEIGYPGELTKRGLMEEFELGKRFRKIYGSHFGDTYNPPEFHVYTGQDNRTSTSAQAMFAGFFPPTKDQTWNPMLSWIPIAQETDQSVDWVSLGVFDKCPIYGGQLSETVEYTSIMQKMEETDGELVQVVRNNTGDAILTAKDYNHVIDSLKIRVILKDKRLPLPKWAKGYETRILKAGYDVHKTVVRLQNGTVGNYHVETIMSYFETYFLKNHTKGTFISGHDTNILAIWEAFRLVGHPADIPFFGAHLAIELHQDGEDWNVKFFLAMGFNQTRVELFSDLCGKNCSWEALQNITENSRLSRADWAFQCKGIETLPQPVSTITGSMIILLAILLLSTIILGFTTCSYKRQLNNMRDPERARLLQ